MPLDNIPVTRLSGTGPRTAEKLLRLGIATAQDLLFHLPARYQDRTQITPIGAVREGMGVVVEGEIAASDIVHGRRRSLLCRLSDNTGIIGLRLFYFTAAQKNQLQRGNRIRCFGEVRQGAAGYELYHPEYRLAHHGALPPLEQVLTPIYPTTDGISQAKLRQLLKQALTLLDKAGTMPDLIPRLPGIPAPSCATAAALRFIHAPPASELNVQALAQLAEHRHPIQQQLAFEELVAHHLSLLQARQRIQTNPAPPLAPDSHFIPALLQRLSFSLTSAQQQALQEISHDLGQPVPMLRLLQGDVGSGKTIVAALAALQSVDSGCQAALMAPTEILAEQHRDNFAQWLEPLGIKTAFLSGKVSAKKKREALERIANGNAQVVIGTHALFQKDVVFQQLGLVIIDEQHRFGVHQRLSLAEKGKRKITPHQLVMTATPIPRTLAMCAYADLDNSVIDELPPGRTPVETILISDQRRDQVIERVRQACVKGRQAYWVCTLIEESETLQCQAAEATAATLQKVLGDLRVALVHGRLKPAEKTAVMTRFKQGEIDLLVATTVIEVGVDVPNASLMIIENPERLGLAQLHQLRGRVGRGTNQSFCVLMYHGPLSRQSKQRLSAMRDTNNGFIIAEKDLELRGPGEILGTKQAGIMTFRVVDIERDKALIPMARDCAVTLLSEHPSNAQKLVTRWMGARLDYAQA